MALQGGCQSTGGHSAHSNTELWCQHNQDADCSQSKHYGSDRRKKKCLVQTDSVCFYRSDRSSCPDSMWMTRILKSRREIKEWAKNSLTRETLRARDNYSLRVSFFCFKNVRRKLRRQSYVRIEIFHSNTKTKSFFFHCSGNTHRLFTPRWQKYQETLGGKLLF